MNVSRLYPKLLGSISEKKNKNRTHPSLKCEEHNAHELFAFLSIKSDQNLATYSYSDVFIALQPIVLSSILHMFIYLVSHFVNCQGLAEKQFFQLNKSPCVNKSSFDFDLVHACNFIYI